jgi:hypothetical protein
MARRSANKLTLRDIEQWVDNDEGLYRMWKASRQTKRQFVRENRDTLSEMINKVISGERKPHYLVYG